MLVLRRAMLVLALLAGLVPALTASPAAAVQADATSFITVVGDPGDQVTHGGGRQYASSNSTMHLLGSRRDGVLVTADGDDGSRFTFSFSAPSGQSLEVGEYTDAERSHAGAHPGIDVTGDVGGCNETSGRFTVLDVTDDLSRLWLVYEQHCEGRESALFGEIKINEPAPAAGLVTRPDRVDWPFTRIGASARTVPVRVTNPTGSMISVPAASVSRDSDFELISNGCSAVAPGATCTMTLGFTPSEEGRRTGNLSFFDSTGATHTVPLTGDGLYGHTSWSMNSQPGDDIGWNETFPDQAARWSYSPVSATFTAEGTDQHVRLSILDWRADFSPGDGRSLEAGASYHGARVWSEQSGTDPGLDVRGMGRSCDALTGGFTVHEATYDTEGQVRAFSVTFEQHCHGGAPALFGSIAYRAQDEGAAIPASVTVATDRAAYAYGDTALVTATLSEDEVTREVKIYAGQNGSSELVASGAVDADGRLAVRVPLEQRTTFAARVAGFDDADLSTVDVSARVIGTMAGYRFRSARGYYHYRFPHAATIRALVAPNHAPDCVRVRTERFRSGAWHFLARSNCHGLDENSRYSHVFHPRSSYVGSHLRMRIEWPGDNENTASTSAWRYLIFDR